MHSFSRCVEKFNRVYEYPLFIIFAWELLGMSSLLVSVQFQLVEYTHFTIFDTSNRFSNVNIIHLSFYLSKWDDDSSMFELAFTLLLVPWVFVLFFLSCEPGERVTSQFELFGEELDRCNWYALPIKMQRIYLIFLCDSQQLRDIQGYGGIVCSRETFKKVFNMLHAVFFDKV